MSLSKCFISALLIALATSMSMDGSSARVLSDLQVVSDAAPPEAEQLAVTEIQAVPKPAYSTLFGWPLVPVPRWPSMPIAPAFSKGAAGLLPPISAMISPLSPMVSINPAIPAMTSIGPSVPPVISSNPPISTMISVDFSLPTRTSPPISAVISSNLPLSAGTSPPVPDSQP